LLIFQGTPGGPAFRDLQHAPSFLSRAFRHFVPEAAEQVKVGSQQLSRGACKGAEICLGKWLWRKIRILRIGRQGQMELRRPSAQQRGRIEIGANLSRSLIRQQPLA